MNFARVGMCLTLVVSLTATLASTAQGQDFIGEAIGKVVLPGLGEAAKRGIGEELGERLLGGRPWRPSPQPSPVPTPMPYPLPRPQPQPQPIPYPQPHPQPNPIWRPSPPKVVNPPVIITKPYIPIESAPAPPTAPSNKIVRRILPAKNVSPQEVALTLVLERGLASSIRFARRESGELSRSLRAGLSVDDATSSQRVQAADLAEAIAADTAPISKATLTSTQQRVDALRDNLSHVAADASLPAGELAVIAQRAKNIKNMLVLGDLAHLLGAQRRDDLFPVLADAVRRADAPANVMPALTGFIAVIGPEDTPPGFDDEPQAALFTPSSATQSIQFIVDRESPATLGPGEMIWFDRSFVVTFDNGAGQTKSYTLSNGTYAWSLNEDRIDVNKRPQMRLAIDAGALPVDFELLLGGQKVRLDAGQQNEWMITRPQRIIFDRGRRGLEPSSSVYFGGDFKVGVNTTTGGYELIPASILEDAAIQEDDVTELTVNSVAKLHWRRSLDETMRRPGPRGEADSAVESLLDGIE